MRYQGTKRLEQNVFENQPEEVDWCGVDYDGLLKFGIATNPRYTWASERWRGFEEINRIENSGYEALTSLQRTINNIENMKQVITMICAATDNNVIGIDNKLPFFIKKDLQRFKDLTSGHCIIMGRKTFESLPGILPNRVHIVITRNKQWSHPNVTTAHSLEHAIEITKVIEDVNPFIIGGGEIYKLGMEIATRIELTRIHSTIDGDTFFPEINMFQWDAYVDAEENSMYDEKEDVVYSFVTYKKAVNDPYKYD